MRKITLIGFDADDTLWDNECHFRAAEAAFLDLVSTPQERERALEVLLAVELRNIPIYGFGVKGFTLSMLEAAIELGAISQGADAEAILALGRGLLSYEVSLLPHAEAAIKAARARSLQVVLITKGDLHDQERKLAQSGLGGLFDWVEVVSHKTPEQYRAIAERHGHAPEAMLMVGNSVKSDVLPVLELGGVGVHVPSGPVWVLDHAEPPLSHERFHVIEDLGGLDAVLSRYDCCAR